MPHFLEKVTLTGIRGIYDLQVKFEYPVSVLAGRNGSGKSTVLFATACAYAPPGTDTKGLGAGPLRFFPDYRSKSGGQEDVTSAFTFRFQYSTPDGRRTMSWHCFKESTNAVEYCNGSEQPERSIYLITPGNLINPSGMGPGGYTLKALTEPQEIPFTLPQIAFAQQFLSFRYSRVVNLIHPDSKLKSGSKGNLLLAEQENGVMYSELHMAAGERAILRLSKEILQAKSGLVLIDEVEAGLHPAAQKILMLELQQLALRNDLQIIVTTHSPVVLDSVPKIGRIFLDRNEEGNILVHPPYLDLIQDVLYGRSDRKFNVLCEDGAAKGILDGVFDVLTPRLLIKGGSLNIEYTENGVGPFPRYAEVLEQFDQNVIFILDGDQRGGGVEQDIQTSTKRPAEIMFLPGAGAPEEWVWDRMRADPNDFVTGLRLDRNDLVRQMQRGDALYDSASSSASEIAKDKLHELSQIVHRTVPDICRIVSCRETERPESDIQPLVEYLEAAFREWRSGT